MASKKERLCFSPFQHKCERNSADDGETHGHGGTFGRAARSTLVGETAKLRLDIDWTPEMMFSALLYRSPCYQGGGYIKVSGTPIKGQSPALRGRHGSTRAWEGCQ